MLADSCADPGIFARVVQAPLPENSSDNVFCLFLSSTFTVLQWLINGLFKKNYNFTRFRGWGGVQMLILETHRTFDFTGGVADPLSPLWIRTCDHLTTRN